MPYDLKGRNVLITGGSSSEAAASDLAKAIEEEYGVKTTTVKADVGVTAECERCVQETIKNLGGLDILIGNAGYTKFTTDFGDLDALSEQDWDKCWAVNVKGKLALMRAVAPTFRANPEGGVFLITSSVALHLMKCLATSQGEKVRINAVLPGLLLTDWGNLYGEERIKALKDHAALKKETDLQDCANAFVMLAKNTSITGAKIQVGKQASSLSEVKG
ncbi:hypothetical protein SLS57_005599 [Botryosphaeria dothidea]